MLFLDAKRSIVTTTAKIPYWVMVLLVLLGWNEFLAIITSPVYLIIFVLFGSIAYIVYALNLSGPLERVLRTLAGEAFKLSKGEVYNTYQGIVDLLANTARCADTTMQWAANAPSPSMPARAKSAKEND